MQIQFGNGKGKSEKVINPVDRLLGSGCFGLAKRLALKINSKDSPEIMFLVSN